MQGVILAAGATGDLGLRIVKALIKKGANVRVVTRSITDIKKRDSLNDLGVEIYTVTSWNMEELALACKGATCVVSVLAGLREVIIAAQKVLLDAAVSAGVPRFIPSDYSIDFTKFSHGENRNLDLRREFHTLIDNAPISATSIFNGAFTELITGQMPVILFKQKLVLYWGDANYKWGFTTMDNTAEYTANAALDSSSPRYLRIAGDQISPREIKNVVSEVTDDTFRLLRPGGKGLLGVIIKIARKFSPGERKLYPAWQGMQYMRNMIDERSKLATMDNDRYPGIQWTTVKDVLISHFKK